MMMHQIKGGSMLKKIDTKVDEVKRLIFFDS